MVPVHAYSADLGYFFGNFSKVLEFLFEYFYCFVRISVCFIHHFVMKAYLVPHFCYLDNGFGFKGLLNMPEVISRSYAVPVLKLRHLKISVNCPIHVVPENNAFFWGGFKKAVHSTYSIVSVFDCL